MRRATIFGLVAAASMSLAGCAVPHHAGLPDVRGTWRLQTESGEGAAQISIDADHTSTAHAIPAPIACGTEVYSGSPPGCADGRDAVDFSGKWKLSDDEPRELRLYYADFLVRKGYRDGSELGFSVRTLEAPRPDYVFVRATS
jgi:hypothetical protein